MPIIHRVNALHAEMTAWRREIHAHPETAFEEARTSDFVAEKLSSFGVEVHRGLAKTGVVGTLRAGSGHRAIGLRADMDALHVHEANTFAHRSRNEGKMHACGHDGHTAMLLGAAKHLAETRAFEGTVHFIFQPAEENEGGGRVMVEDGLFEKFPVEAVFGMHNWPGIPAGQFAVMPGIMMASFDIFEIKITGRGAHAGMPHHAVDPIVAGSALVQALQAIASRSVSPVDAAVVSVTQFHAGDTWNVIPDEVTLRGSARALKPEVQALVEGSLRRICEGIAAAHGCRVTVRYEHRYPPIINTPKEVGMAIAAMSQVIGGDNVHTDIQPTMGAEDFAFMLRERPGAYVWLGNGVGAESRMLHNPGYDFNDEILPIGASYWVTLVEQTLSKKALV